MARIPDDVTVLRVVKYPSRMYPENAAGPMRDAFFPNSGDYRDAAERGIPVQVSVFDQTLTTPEQAIAIRNLGKPMPLVYQVLGLLVQHARAVNPDRIDVVRDPLPPSFGPGADGHGGILGLEQKAGERADVYKFLCQKLADLCFSIK